MRSPTPPISSQPIARVSKSRYRKAEPLPNLVLDHITDILEEKLYSDSYSVLSNCLTSGEGSEIEARIPPPQYLTLSATLAVHPALTTRTLSAEKHAASNDALRYLRHVNSLLGPQESGLAKALKFDSSNASRGKRRRNGVSGSASDEDSNGVDRLRLVYADKESLWNHVEDFWSLVGWTFNCSVAHPARWERWSLLLSFMLDVIEDDFQSSLPGATRIYLEHGRAAPVEKELRSCLLSQLLSQVGESRTSKRRLMRSILATATSTDLAEFPEIWRHETKPPKKKDDGRLNKKRKLDIENDEFGDYYDKSDDDLRRSASGTNPSTAKPSREGSEEDSDDSGIDSTGAPSGLEVYGGVESLRLRQRVLGTLSLFCSKNPDGFVNTQELFDIFTEFFRPMSLPVFQYFLLPSKRWLGLNTNAELNRVVLRPLLVNNPPDKEVLTQSMFEASYARVAANNTSAMDNAKVSLLVEGLLRLLWEAGALDMTERFKASMKKGIEARKKKVMFDGRKKVGVKKLEEQDAFEVMEASGERMLVLIDL